MVVVSYSLISETPPLVNKPVRSARFALSAAWQEVNERVTSEGTAVILLPLRSQQTRRIDVTRSAFSSALLALSLGERER